MHGALRGVHRQLCVICADSVAVGVGEGEQATQQHLVRTRRDPGDEIGRLEGGLFDLGEKVVRMRFSVSFPTRCSGKSACGHTLVRSNGLNLYPAAASSGMTWM